MIGLIVVLLVIQSFYCFANGEINPNADTDLFAIKWPGPGIDLDRDGVEVVTMTTESNERYQCVLPESQASIDAHRKASYNGPTPDKLMEQLLRQSTCSYRIESYWTYELCHGKHIKQYHENKELGLQKPKLQEYYLGKGNERTYPSVTPENKGSKEVDIGGAVDEETVVPADASGTPDDTYTQEILTMKIEGIELPYYSVNMTDGTVCDVTDTPRKSHVMYICQPEGRGEIYLLKETSSCEYDIVVLTSVLCSHPEFKPKDPPVSQIKCHSSTGIAWKPEGLLKLEHEQLMFPEQKKKKEEQVVHKQGVPQDQARGQPVQPLQAPPVQRAPDTRQPTQPPKVDTTIGKTADTQLLREFIAGEYCLHGGGGWWKHEFCYGKYAKQYHEEQGSAINIFLGHWDKQKHIQWLQDNPTKQPKPPGSRTQLSLFYSGGDTCDLTGKKRFVEVKLKCLKRPNQPHAVSIYLVEPKPCEYILGVESPILCDVLNQADSNGLLDHIKV